MRVGVDVEVEVIVGLGVWVGGMVWLGEMLIDLSVVWLEGEGVLTNTSAGSVLSTWVS
jgi:hypothetical protein